MRRVVKPKRAYNASLRQEQAQLTRHRILGAARKLLVEGVYSRVTMEEIARHAGVAYQTLYVVFRTKLRLAEAIIAEDWPLISAALKMLDQARDSGDPAVWLAVIPAMSRRIYEPCADLMRFLRESGDVDLLGQYRHVEQGRYAQLQPLVGLLNAREAVDLIWSLSGPELYIQLVFERGWTPDRYERWLAETLRVLFPD
ncbi:MAG TPA: helix-turn-helix domain-containing protein [Candidatus Dormibacteraeota bacterium]